MTEYKIDKNKLIVIETLASDVDDSEVEIDDVIVIWMMPDRESVGAGTAGSGFLPLQFPSAFAAFHAAPPSAPTAMHHASHYHHHAQ